MRRFWSVQSADELTQEFRPRADILAKLPWRTIDFVTMYTKLTHTALVNDVMEAVTEAWQYYAEQSGCSIFLGKDSWTTQPDNIALTLQDFEQRLRILVSHLYVCNGSTVLQQTCGLPMGVEPAPQLANLACYAREARAAWRWLDRLDHPLH